MEDLNRLSGKAYYSGIIDWKDEPKGVKGHSTETEAKRRAAKLKEKLAISDQENLTTFCSEEIEYSDLCWALIGMIIDNQESLQKTAF